MTTSNPPTAAQPIDLFPCPFCGGENIDPAEWSGNDGKSGPGCGDCGALAEFVEAWNTRALARQQPAARVDRIISASGLAEVSVFLESALKVGTVLYAAAPSAEQAPAAARRAAERINAMHKGVVSVLSGIRAEHEASAAGAGSAPHAQAAPVYQVRVIEQSWAWTDASEEAYHTFSEKRRRILYAAPVPQEAEQAGDIELIRIPAHDADSYCRILSIIGMEEEGDPMAEVQRLFDAAQEAEQAAPAAVTAPAGVTLKAIRAHDSKEWLVYIEHPFGTSYVRMGDRRDLQLAELIACQPAAPAVTDERALFEAWSASAWKYNLTPAREESRDAYMEGETETAWMAWEARAAIQPAAPAAVTDAARDVLADAKKFDWMKAERIRDEDHVDEALQNFREDPTGDNATGVIQAALTVWIADTALRTQSKE